MSGSAPRIVPGPPAAGSSVPTSLAEELRAADSAPGAAEFPANPVLLNLLERRTFEHDGRHWRAAHSIEPEVAQRIGRLILCKGLGRGLEIGTLYGFSTLYLAEAFAATGGHLETIDLRPAELLWDRHRDPEPKPIRNVHEVAERLVRESGFAEVVDFVPGHSNDVLPRLIRDGRSYDLALVDGAHAFPTVLLDVVGVDAVLPVGGYLVLDDVHAEMAERGRNAGGPNRALEVLAASGRYAVVPLSRHTVICRKERA